MKGKKGSSIALAREVQSLCAGGLSRRAVARMLGMTHGQVQGLLQTAERNRVREFDRVHLGTPMTLTGDWIVIGDVHVPCTDYPFAQLVLRVAQRYGIRNLLIAGDMFNQDVFGAYADVVIPPSWADELKAAQYLFHEWVEAFDSIAVLMGNHDRRLQKWTNAELGASEIFGMVNSSDKITVSNYGYCTVLSADEKWRVTHPRGYSRVRLSLANEIAEHHDCHIISFHEHHTAMSYDTYGRHIIINAGTLANPENFAYAVLDDSRSPAMTNSFAMIRNGVGSLFGKYPLTDWTMI